MASSSWSSALLAFAVGAVVATVWNDDRIHHGGTETRRPEPSSTPIAVSSREIKGTTGDAVRNEDASVTPCLRGESAVPDCLPVVGFVPSTDRRITRALSDGATLAFDEARAAGGPSLALVVGGGAASQWESVASETVRLACDERVVAVIAPPERALAHPVAQAATRCRVPVLSTSNAPTVTAAGSRFVLAVVPLRDDPRDAPLVAPTFDARAPDAAAFVAAFRARFHAEPDAWAAAGYDAARVVVETVRRVGLSRDSFVAAASDGTAVTGAAGALRFGRLGRLETAKN